MVDYFSGSLGRSVEFFFPTAALFRADGFPLFRFDTAEVQGQRHHPHRARITKDPSSETTDTSFPFCHED